MSIANACVSTSQGLQVFYRDDSQGILLGAVKTLNGWVYEIVDGDKTSEGRTTGDVAFHLSATSVKNAVYLIYDSVLTINSNRDATSGEVRLATRKRVFPEDWRYQTLDGPDNGVAVAGYTVALNSVTEDAIAAWLVTNPKANNDSKEIRFAMASKPGEKVTLNTTNLGTPAAIIAINHESILFDCFGRICEIDLQDGSHRLVYAKRLKLKAGTIFKSKTQTFTCFPKGRGFGCSKT